MLSMRFGLVNFFTLFSFKVKLVMDKVVICVIPVIQILLRGSLLILHVFVWNHFMRTHKIKNANLVILYGLY